MHTTEKHSGCDIKSILAQKALDGPSDFWRQKLENVSAHDVERALASTPGSYSIEKLLALISQPAQYYLEQMAQLSHQLTIKRFGRTIKLFAPLYLSNYCVNSCRYCGFNKENKFQRTRLTIDQALADADTIAAEGFRDILLVSSEDKNFINMDYLANLAKKLKAKFSSVSMEIFALTAAEYAQLFHAGIDGVTMFQETYNRQAFEKFHPAGPKSDFDNRLDTFDRVASAGMRELGLGVLLGLNDWRLETLALAEHAHYLIKHYWQSRVSFSFPRMRPAFDVDNFKYDLLTDRSLVQMILALRLCFADAGIVISTREPAALRDRLIKLGVTKISAGSKTNPGGYTTCTDAVGQFEVDDSRTPAQIAAMVKQNGYDPVWKDWDSAFAD